VKNIIWRSLIGVCLLATVLGASDVPDDARRTIKAANDAWLPALKQENAVAIAEPYADDGVFVSATGQVATGRAAIQDLMKARFAAGRVMSGSLEQDGIRKEGSLIYEWGHAETEVQTPDGKLVKGAGRYLTVWKANTAGRWQIIRNLSLVG
jgi:uncharacterized protein (TIGR02246 family)